MDRIPHFFPFRCAYEIGVNFPLCQVAYTRVNEHKYLLGVDSTATHPIYTRVMFQVTIDMEYIEKTYEEPDACLADFMAKIIETMRRRLRPNLSEATLKRYAPWMTLPNFS
jgi:hypothetical protein